jgi:methylmalonyl-CoA carboxyltransferase large subunit
MGAFLFTLIGGAIGGALASRYVIRREMDQLRAAFKERASAPPPPAPEAVTLAVEPAAPQPEISAEITPEILMVISAAVAAFFGNKARIRRARAAGAPVERGSAWAQQGRVFVQASHNLAR